MAETPHKEDRLTETKELLRKKCHEIFELIANKAEPELQQVLAFPEYFSVLVGLIPEKIFVPSSVRDEVGQINIDKLIKFFRENELDVYSILKPQRSWEFGHDSPVLSLVNISALRERVEEVEGRFPEYELSLDINANSFIESFIAKFSNLPQYQKDFWYGIVSGFPGSAAYKHSEKMKRFAAWFGKTFGPVSDVQAFEVVRDGANSDSYSSKSPSNLNNFVPPTHWINWSEGNRFGVVGYKYDDKAELDVQELDNLLHFVFIEMGMLERLKLLHNKATALIAAEQIEQKYPINMNDF